MREVAPPISAPGNGAVCTRMPSPEAGSRSPSIDAVRREVAMAVSVALGTERTVELTGGTLAYRERGTGPAVVFVHGLLVNGDLWRKVVPPVAEAGHRCLTPDWPFGSHPHPMRPDADLSPPG